MVYTTYIHNFMEYGYNIKIAKDNDITILYLWMDLLLQE